MTRDVGFRHRGLFQARRRSGQLKPGAAAGESRRGGQVPDGLETKSPDVGKVQQFFVPRIEMFPDGFGIIGGQRKKFFYLGPFQQIARLDDVDMEGDGKAIRGSAFFLFMVLRGQEIEGSALEDAIRGGFPKTGLTEENGLLTGGDGGADRGQLLKAETHFFLRRTVCWTRRG